MQLRGAELVIYPTAIGSEPDHPTFDTQPIWRHVISAQCPMNGIFIAAVNRTGDEGSGVQFYGSSFVSDPMGRVVAEAPRGQSEVVIATLDFATRAFWGKLFPLLEGRRPHAYAAIADPSLRASINRA